MLQLRNVPGAPRRWRLGDQARRAARRAACRARRTAVSFTESDTPVSQPAVELQLRAVDASRNPAARRCPHPAAHRRRVAAALARAAAHTRARRRRRHHHAWWCPPPPAIATTTRGVEAATASEPRHAWGSVEAATARREPHRTAQVRRSSDQRTACGANHRVEGQVVRVHAASRLPDP